jgi:hypothetical protein
MFIYLVLMMYTIKILCVHGIYYYSPFVYKVGLMYYICDCSSTFTEPTEPVQELWGFFSTAETLGVTRGLLVCSNYYYEWFLIFHFSFHKILDNYQNGRGESEDLNTLPACTSPDYRLETSFGALQSI